MELVLFFYLQPISYKLDLKNDFFDNSKFSFPIIFQNFSCYLGNLCLCQIRGLINARILGFISVLMQAVPAIEEVELTNDHGNLSEDKIERMCQPENKLVICGSKKTQTPMNHDECDRWGRGRGRTDRQKERKKEGKRNKEKEREIKKSSHPKASNDQQFPCSV